MVYVIMPPVCQERCNGIILQKEKGKGRVSKGGLQLFIVLNRCRPTRKREW